MKHIYLPQTGRTQLAIVDTEFLKDKKMDDLLYGYIRINSKWYSATQYYSYCYKDLVTAKNITKYFKEKGERPYPFTTRTFSTHLKLLEEAGWVYSDGTIGEEIEDSGKEVYAFRELFPKQYVIIPLDTMKLLVNTAIPNIIKTYSFLKFKMEQHNYHKQSKPDNPKYSFSRKSLLETIGYTSLKQNHNDMIDEILNILQEKGLIEIHAEYKSTKGNIKNPYFILDAVYDAAKAEKNIAEIDNLPLQQKQSNKDEEIPAPQINRAEILKSCSVDELEAEIRRRALEQKKKELNNEWRRYLDGFVF